jgi:hypothetical protein
MGLGKTGPTAVVRVVMVGQMDRAVFLAGRVPLTLGLMVARAAWLRVSILVVAVVVVVVTVPVAVMVAAMAVVAVVVVLAALVVTVWWSLDTL